MQNYSVSPVSPRATSDVRYSTHISQGILDMNQRQRLRQPQPLGPNTYTATTAGPIFKVSMGALPSGISAVGSALYNTAGQFRSMRRC